MTVYAYCCLPQDNNGSFRGISVFDSCRLCHWLPSGSPHCNLNQIVSIMGLFISTSWAETEFVPANCCLKDRQVAHAAFYTLMGHSCTSSWVSLFIGGERIGSDSLEILFREICENCELLFVHVPLITYSPSNHSMPFPQEVNLSSEPIRQT